MPFPTAERFIGILKCYCLIQLGGGLAFLMLVAINWVMRTSLAEHLDYLDFADCFAKKWNGVVFRGYENASVWETCGPVNKEKPTKTR